VPLHVAQARDALHADRLGNATAEIGDAQSLRRPDGYADVVLLLGPLYHLTQRDERLQALREAMRVTRPGGLVAAAVISRFASLLDGLFARHLDHPGFEEIMAADLADGQHRNPNNTPGWFTTAYFHHPIEIVPELTEAGLTDVTVTAVEGPAWLLPDLEQRLQEPQQTAALLRTIRRIETEPALLGVSAHLLASGRRGS
jgi:SAM-dependent methyltransferase